MLPIRVPVEEFTTPEPITADESATIDDLWQLMKAHGIRHLPILRGNAVVGVVSDRDVRLVLGLTVAEKLQVRAADIMAEAPLTVSASTTRLKKNAKTPCIDTMRRIAFEVICTSDTCEVMPMTSEKYRKSR